MLNTLGSQTSVLTQGSSYTPLTSGLQDQVILEGKGSLAKGNDGVVEPGKVHDLNERSSKGESILSDVKDSTSLTKNSSSHVNSKPPPSSRTEKSHHKKHSDPDAFYKIKLKGRDYPTAYGFCQEIEYLNKLKGKSHIIQLIDYEVTDKTLLEDVMSGTNNNKDGRIVNDTYIYMLLEYGEVDLAHMVAQKWKENDGTNWNTDENWLRFYWQQMLLAVNTIHEERIVHSDLKPANFMLVKGSLKLIDFGIAKAIMSDTTNIQRDSQVGTLNYMSPEAFMWNEHDANGNTIKCGRPSDIWSLGCILYQMVYGKTPFADYKTFWAKFKVITDRNHKISYDPLPNIWLIDLMKKCLAWDRNKRWRIAQLLQHPFLVPPMPRELPPLDD
ncbi:Mitogen-activated protein kinase kinase kinase NPK1 [Acorus calamus]|uniref:Mitogen-activated protein kinase kinase kinase NPK1 n=1 Tax=Acorus calamus TaxID=4465 RepID=A0AAV9DJF3_ACOCL|nr:Mitogen-activated protein kinase kinase kinase NPK1 [Acorus calamus]